MAPLDTRTDQPVPYAVVVFSRRLHWDVPVNQLSQAIAQRRTSGAELLDLTESNPTRAGLIYPDELLSALTDPSALTYDPSPFGLASAREAVARTYNGISADQIVLTASTSEAYSWLFKLLCDPGDEVLTPRPSYPLFEFLAGLESVRVTQYPLYYYYGWHLDTDSIASSITAATRALVIVNPNNPTGSFLKQAELARLINICAEREIALISDEVFTSYALDETIDDDRVTTLAEVDFINTFCLNGLSKSAGLPQFKLGWIVANGPDRATLLHRLEQIADTFLSVGAPVQYALPSLLSSGARVRAQILNRTRDNLRRLRHAVTRTVCDLLQVEGGWYAILQVPRTRTEEEWAIRLLGEGILVQPGFFYDFGQEAFLVLSLLTPPAVFAEGVRRLLNLVTTEVSS